MRLTSKVRGGVGSGERGSGANTDEMEHKTNYFGKVCSEYPWTGWETHPSRKVPLREDSPSPLVSHSDRNWELNI